MTRTRPLRRAPTTRKSTNLSGVAPKAWIGNYRVFTIPTPLGHEADTPEIVEAFESAVADGMNVINFSGGGPQTDPANDAMYETIHNTALAGVVPVIAAGNDREDFGLGTAGSPGSAPDAITVAATSNSHVFAPALSVVGGPPSLGAIPIQNAGGQKLPEALGDARPADRRRLLRRGHRRQAGRDRICAAAATRRTPVSARCRRTRSPARSCSSLAARAPSSPRRSGRSTAARPG